MPELSSPELPRKPHSMGAPSTLDATLAQLYDPSSMPANAVKAYVFDGGARSYARGAERVALLFRRYAELTVPLNKEGKNAV